MLASKLFQGWGEEAELRIEDAGVEEGWVRRGKDSAQYHSTWVFELILPRSLSLPHPSPGRGEQPLPALPPPGYLSWCPSPEASRSAQFEEDADISPGHLLHLKRLEVFLVVLPLSAHL